MPIRMPLLIAMRRLASGDQLDRVARVDLGELGGAGEVGQVREARLAGLLDEDADRGLRALLGRDGLLAGLDEQHLEAVDVALGDAVGRVERERLLVVLAGGSRARPAPRAPWPAGSRPRSRRRARAGGGSSRPRRPTAASVAWAIACSASWRLRRVWPAGVWAAASISGKVTEGSSFRSIFASRGWHAAVRDTPKPRGSRARVSSIRPRGPSNARRGQGRAAGGSMRRPPRRARRAAPAPTGTGARDGGRRRAVERVPQVEHEREHGRPEQPRHVDRARGAGGDRDDDRVGERGPRGVARRSRSGARRGDSRGGAR